MKSRGFTLLEILVAVSILGMAVAVAMQSFSGGLKNVRRIDLAHRAMGHSENVMNEILSDESLRGPVQLSGDLDDEFSFIALVDYWQQPEEDFYLEIAPPPLILLLVEVQILYKNDRYGKKYHARCLKLVPDSAIVSGSMAPQDAFLNMMGGRRR